MVEVSTEEDKKDQIPECDMSVPDYMGVIQEPFITTPSYDSNFYAGIIQEAFHEDG